MIFRNRNQCHLGKVLIKLVMYNFQRFPLIRLTYNCQVNYAFLLFLAITETPVDRKPRLHAKGLERLQTTSSYQQRHRRLA